MAKKRIPNPSANANLSPEEAAFVKDGEVKSNITLVKRCTPRSLTIHDDVWNDLNVFLKERPEEGSRSSFITRAISEMIRKRRADTRD